MIPDLDIWRAAQLMVKRYGEDAAIQGGRRADERADVDGAATWRAIIRAIEETPAGDAAGGRGGQLIKRPLTGPTTGWGHGQ